MELKYPVADFSEIRGKLAALGAEQLNMPVHEMNHVFDTPDGVLSKTGILLRLRHVSEKVFLTVKEPVKHDSVKIRKEHETRLSITIGAGALMLNALGFHSVYYYEKIREEWAFQGAHICLDELYFGKFVEIECESVEHLGSVSARLGLDRKSGLKESYRTLELQLSGGRNS